ncbi:PPE family protein [Mycobacterium sp. ML4]
MFYAAFPPEINSGRMYMGAGAGPLLAAAAAWNGLAAELQATAAAYESVIAALTNGPWVGPSSMAMAAAATPYWSWMNATAAQAAQAATQAMAAASAYETAFAGHVPPVEIAANRAQLAALVATNIFGQNTPAIAATEAQYGEMWTQDAVAMDTYAGSSAAATQITPFSEPPQITNGAGLAGQAAATGQSVASAAATDVQSILGSGPVSWLLQLGASLSTDYTQTVTGLINSLFGPTGAATYIAWFNAIRSPLAFTTGFNDIGLIVNFPASQFLKFASKPGALLELPKDALGGGLGLGGPHWGRGWLTSSVNPVAAELGRGTLVGHLSVPPSWASATPTIRTVAAALSAAGPDAVPAAALGEGGLFSSMGLAGMLGSAMGAGAPDTFAGSGVRGRMTPLKDLKDATSPEKLKRLVAQISEKPESVQHHRVDEEGLDGLLEQLSKKPGIHAVHLSKGGKPKVVPSDAQLG